jgi:hypothetical protein
MSLRLPFFIAAIPIGNGGTLRRLMNIALDDLPFNGGGLILR